MLALDDQKWPALSHAYGSASDTPALLRQLAILTLPQKEYDSDPWFSLWSSLCHQGNVFTASYAAVPHIVDIACRAEGPIDFSFFQLPAAIEVARQNGKGPALPVEIEDAYLNSISRLMDCVSIHRHNEWDESTLFSALAAQAASKGHFRAAEAIMNLDNSLIEKLINFDLQ